MELKIDPQRVIASYQRADRERDPELKLCETQFLATTAPHLAQEVIRLREENETLRRMVRESIRLGVIVIPPRETDQ